MNPHIIQNVSNYLNKEAVSYFKKHGMIRMSKDSCPSDIAKLKIDELEEELTANMPTTMKFMESISGLSGRREKEAKEKAIKLLSGTLGESDLTKEVSERITKDISAKNTCVVAVVMLLKQHFSSMSKLMYRTTLLLMNGGCRALDIDRLNMQGITMSHSLGIKMQTKMAKEFGKSVEQWKSDVSKKGLLINLLIEIATLLESESSPVILSPDKIKSCPSYDEEIWSESRSYIPYTSFDELCSSIDSKEKLVDIVKNVKKKYN